MTTNVKDIVIVGGGSSGWMTAATLASQLENVNIKVIESPNIPTVGVGESTIGSIRAWMRLVGITDKDLIKLHDPRQMHEHKKLGSWAPGAFAYWLTPQGAKKLIDWAKNDGPGHADKLIGSNVLNWDYLNPHIVKLGSRIGSSTNPDRYPYKEFVF